MRYQVPQFIEIEDKIFGPLTIKQFLYIAGGAALGFMLWNFLPNLLAPFIAIPVFILFISFAFYKYNDRPFIVTIENAFNYFLGSKLYVWNKKQKTLTDSAKVAEQNKKEVKTFDVPRLSSSKLDELSWSLDINENLEDK